MEVEGERGGEAAEEPNPEHIPVYHISAWMSAGLPHMAPSRCRPARSGPRGRPPRHSLRPGCPTSLLFYNMCLLTDSEHARSHMRCCQDRSP